MSNYNKENSQIQFFETDCNICFHTFFEDNDPVVYCSKCKISFHQSCYGIQKIPQNDYYCDICEIDKGKKKFKNYNCALCKKQGLALKKIENYWFHIQCLVLMNLTNLQDYQFKFYKVQLTDIINTIIKFENNDHQCHVCNSNQGFMVKCSYCDNYIHFLCAYLDGYTFQIEQIKQKKYFYLKSEIICDQHKNEDQKKQKFLRRFQINFDNISNQYQNYDDFIQQKELNFENEVQKKIKLIM